MKVVWKDTVLAEASRTIKVDGYHYFKPFCVRMAYLKESDFTTSCPSKGKARYWDIEVDGERLKNVAFSYPKTYNGEAFEGDIAFWIQDHDIDGPQIIE